MTGLDFSLCVSAVLSSSTSQLFLKAAAARTSASRAIVLLGIAVTLQIFSVLLAILALRTLHLSQLVSFAAFAYVLVPVGSHFVFGDRLRPRFWVGAIMIVAGILCANF